MLTPSFSWGWIINIFAQFCFDSQPELNPESESDSQSSPSMFIHKYSNGTKLSIKVSPSYVFYSGYTIVNETFKILNEFLVLKSIFLMFQLMLVGEKHIFESTSLDFHISIFCDSQLDAWWKTIIRSERCFLISLNLLLFFSPSSVSAPCSRSCNPGNAAPAKKYLHIKARKY